MRITAKGPVYSDPAVSWLSQLSKSALIDLVVDLIRQKAASADDPVPKATAIDFASPILRARGDRIPK